ncbi:hypothetical protein KKG05_11675 [bacterium]|nr:hypothetical protein [bacterium]MBU1938049.1 hypothetical protein [bacterium]
MKTRMLLLALLLIGFSNLAFGAWIGVNSPIADQVPMVNIQSTTTNVWQMDISVPGLTHETFSQEGSMFDRLSLPMEMMAGDEGEAELPVVSRMIALRLNGNPEIEIISENWVELDGTYELAPDVESELATVYTQRDDYLPEASFTVTPRQVMGGVSLAIVQVRAAKYNPVQRKIMVLQNAEILVHETGAPISYNRPITETTAGILKAVVPNWEDVLMNVEIVKGTLLYILANNSLDIDDLVTWRTRKGYTVEVLGPNEIGSMTTTNIKDTIESRYDKVDPPLEFVCLVGDANGTYGVPAYYYTGYWYSSTGPGDYDYTRLDGNDLLPDIAIGRLSIESISQLAVIVNKTVQYERNPSSPSGGGNPSWYKGGGLFAGGTGSGISPVYTMRWVHERMLDAGFTSSSIDTVYFINESVNASKMNSSMNSGISLFCYRGYLGMEDYGTGSVSGLTNVRRLPYMLTLTCSTNDYDGYTFCEALLRAGSVASPTGVIGVVGMSTIDTRTRFNNCIIGGAVQGLLREGIHTTGGSMVRACAELRLNYPNDSTYAAFFCGIAALLGDPAVDVFTDTPEQLYVDNPSTTPVGTNSMTLTVTGESAQPIEDAYVNLVKGSEVFVGDWTNASGEVILNFETTSAESLFVTVTKHNCRPAVEYTLVQSTSMVSPSTLSFTIDDDNSGESSGDDDGVANPGETIELAVPLKNWGGSTVTGVNATIGLADPFLVSINDNTESYGTIASGGTVSSGDDFDFTIASYVPDGHILQFNLTVTDDVPTTWESVVPVTVSNGNFEYYGHSFTDVGDGVLDPGETGEVYLRLDNVGTRTIQAGTVGYLRSGNPTVEITDSVGTFIATTPGNQGNNLSDKFGISATMNAFPGERVPMTCIFPLDEGFADTVYCSFVIGTVASTDPTPPDSHGYWAFDNTDVAFDKHPTYSWIEIDPDQGGSGNVLNIIDNADEDDATTVVSLPFTFTYYGQNYTQISVCSNGWLAMGADQAVHTTFRNWNIPGALGPAAMIAPFWDDLRTEDPDLSPGINPPSIRSIGPSLETPSNDYFDSYTEELFYRIEDYKAQDLYDAELWNDYYELMNDGKSSSGHLDEGGETCATAPAISGPFPYTDTGNTSNNIDDYYVGEWGDGCPYATSSAPDVVYAYTPAANITVDIDLSASSYDTKLYVYDNCSTEHVVACDDDGGGSFTSKITNLGLTASVTYYIVVDGYGSSSGAYSMTIYEVIPPEPSGVYSYHDAANHRFIVEWSNVYKFNGTSNPTETFECILYEPGYPVTPTGDGEILFQYETCTNSVDEADYHGATSNDYATVGIENLTETDGVLYSYFNNPAAGAASLTSGRAILFTTQKAPPGEPKAPENLTAIRSGNDIELRWDAVTQDVFGNPITVSGYNIYRDTTPDFTPGGGNFLNTTSNTYYTDTGGASGSKYFYIIQATY